MDITPTDSQYNAIKQIRDWYQSLEFEEDGRLAEYCLPFQVFRVFGYAGTGKTTITKFAIEELGIRNFVTLDEDGVERLVRRVQYAAFTGKAALVMRRAGTPANTVHSLIYSVMEATEEEIDALELQLKQMRFAAMQLRPGQERLDQQALCVELERKIRRLKSPIFGLNEDSDLKDANLLVLDECSMIGEEMAADLMSFRKPILVLGDPGQLPPIKGEGAFTNTTPDVLLTEIHRQAAESPIIRLATMAREGTFIPYGRFSDDVWKMRRRDVTPEMLLAGGANSQVICGYNKTRLDLNNAMRRTAGFDMGNYLPTSDKEKVICLRNRNDVGLINGMFLTLHDIAQEDEYKFHARIKDYDAPDGFYLGSGKHLPIYTGDFKQHQTFDPQRHENEWKEKKGLVEATFGWAITCHKAQGSGWDYVYVWDDHLAKREAERRKWLYTAITRAIKGLLILD